MTEAQAYNVHGWPLKGGLDSSEWQYGQSNPGRIFVLPATGDGADYQAWTCVNPDCTTRLHGISRTDCSAPYMVCVNCNTRMQELAADGRPIPLPRPPAIGHKQTSAGPDQRKVSDKTAL